MHDESKTLTAVNLTTDAGAPVGFSLQVTSGTDRGRTFELDAAAPGRVLVGTGPACTIRLEDSLVSRRHCALEVRGGLLVVTDLGSTNGTMVDRVKIIEAELIGDEVLRVGSTMLRVIRHDDAPLQQQATSTGFGRLLGASPEMRRLYPLCARLAATTVPVIIEGETGTGKEVLAESLHEQGARRGGPFVVFDCTAVPPGLVEAELFGHERGAFTGAVSTRRGVFEQAHGGTLLIDEIGDLELTLQPKLLRALERGEVRRVGAEKWQQVDVRVLAATRRDLDAEVQAGRFRDDLFHRLAVARIELPPLRNRHGDVEVLARHLWKQLGGAEHALSPEVIARWASERWAGNVRELRNAVARHFALGDLQVASRRRVETALAQQPTDPQSDPIERLLALDLPFTEARDRLHDEFERRYVERLLLAHGGDLAKAADASGIGRRYFQKLRARTREQSS